MTAQLPAAGKLLRARNLRIDTTLVAADIDHPTDADLLEHAVRTMVGWSAACGSAARPPAPASIGRQPADP